MSLTEQRAVNSAAASLSGIPSQSIHPTHRRRAPTRPPARRDVVSIALVNVGNGFQLRSPIALHPADIISTIFAVLDNFRIGYCMLLLLRPPPHLLRTSAALVPTAGLIVVADSVIDAGLCAVFHAANRQPHRARDLPSAVVNLIYQFGSETSNGASLKSSTLTYVRFVRTNVRRRNAQSIVVKTLKSGYCSCTGLVRAARHQPARMAVSLQALGLARAASGLSR